MDKYYYNVAQLPMVFFGQEPSMLPEEFLGEAEKWLTPGDYGILSGTDMDDAALDRPGPAVLQQYREYEYTLRRELAAWRADRDFRPLSFALPLVTEGTPLDRETDLLRLRWDFVEELESGHHFDLEALILFFLKLQILRRLFTFEREKGLAVFQNLCEVAQ